MPLRGSITDLYVWDENSTGTLFSIGQTAFNQYRTDFADKTSLTTILAKPMYLAPDSSTEKRNITAFFSGKSIEEILGFVIPAVDILDKVLGITLTLGMENISGVNKLILLARSADGKGRYPPELAGTDLGQGRQYKIAPNGSATEINATEFNTRRQAFVTAAAGHARLLDGTNGETQFLISKQTLYLMLSISGTQTMSGNAEIHLGVRTNDTTETDADQKNYVVLVAKKTNTEYIVGSTCPPKWYHPGA